MRVPSGFNCNFDWFHAHYSTHVEREINKRISTFVQDSAMALGKTVKALREARGWTLKDLSKRSGVPIGTIGALEVRDSVRSEYAPKLAIGFGILLEELLPATATATLTAPTGTLSAAGSASKQWPATVNTAQCATDTIAIVDTLLDKMAATDQTDRAMIGATLAALAANPHDAKKRDLLLQMLDSSAFAEVRQKVA